MKILFMLIFSFLYLFSCDGDCMKCHPKLLKKGKLDDNHKILRECKKCHQINSNDLEKMGSLCGQDCWDCHNIQKVSKVAIAEHIILNQCIKCHTKLKKDTSLYKFYIQHP